MSELQMSKHAQLRTQQRHIPPLIIEWLHRFGVREFDHRGAEIRYFDKRSRRVLAGSIGQEIVDRLSELLDVYMVVSSDGVVITIGHRYKRFNH